jgi:hypothetical protein
MTCKWTNEIIYFTCRCSVLDFQKKFTKFTSKVRNFQIVILPPVMKYLRLSSKLMLWVCSSWTYHFWGSLMSLMQYITNCNLQYLQLGFAYCTLGNIRVNEKRCMALQSLAVIQSSFKRKGHLPCGSHQTKLLLITSVWGARNVMTSDTQTQSYSQS